MSSTSCHNMCEKLSCNDLMKNEKLPKYMKVERKKSLKKLKKKTPKIDSKQQEN